MSTAASPGLNSTQSDRRRNFVPMMVAFLIGLGLLLSFEWGAPTPQFRPDALGIVLFFVFTATVMGIAGYLWRYRSLLGSRFCPACSRRIPFDARLCPYCGHPFPL